MTAHRSPKVHRDPPTSPPPSVDDFRRAASKVWAQLEAQPGFSERIEEGQRQLDAGQCIPFDPDPLRPPEREPPSVPELAHWAATGRPPRRAEVDELASAWRSCLVRAGLLALALILVGLVAGLVGRAT